MLFEILIQVIITVFELRSISKDKNDAVNANADTLRYEPLSEEHRRVVNYKKSALISFLALINFIVVLGIGDKWIEGRSCGLG